jgi:MFS family permease
MPLLDLRILARAGVWQGALVLFASTVGLYVSSTSIPFLFQTPRSSGFGFGADVFTVALALTTPAILMALLSPTTSVLMRRLGSKGTMLTGSLFGLGGLGMAFAHSSIWVNVLWLATIGIWAAWGGVASYSVAAEAVPARLGVIVATLFNAACGIGAGVSTAAAGYVLSLRTVSIDTAMSTGVVTEVFPTEATFTWSAFIIGASAVLGICCVLTIKSKNLHAADREVDAVRVVL